jgi:hypothetical protein
MTAQDAIDFADINFPGIQTPASRDNSAGGTLSVTDGTHTANIANDPQALATSRQKSSARD